MLTLPHIPATIASNSSGLPLPPLHGHWIKSVYSQTIVGIHQHFVLTNQSP